jgi:hypothetical protein
MKVKLLTISSLVVIAVSLSGCLVGFTNPPAGKAKEDKVLMGRWISEDEDAKGAILQFQTGLRGEINVSLLPAAPKEKNPMFTANLFQIGTHSYMVLNPTDEDRDKGFLIAKYAINDGELTVWLLNSEKVANLIKQKKLTGEVGQGGGTVTDSADNVSRFLQSRDAEEAFEALGKFRKAGG